MTLEYKPLTYEQMTEVDRALNSAYGRMQTPIADLKWHPGRVSLTLSITRATRGDDTIEVSYKVESVQHEHTSALYPTPDAPDPLVEVELHTGEPRPEDVL
jgi:hypothetical protein